MNDSQQNGQTTKEGPFLAGTYQRILRNTIGLSVVSVIAGTAWFGWRCGAALTLGSAVAYINFRWLHHGSKMMVERMLSVGRYSRAALIFAFLGRSIIVIAVAYVIFESSLQAFYCFLVALLMPIAGAICEAVYEGLWSRSTSQIPN